MPILRLFDKREIEIDESSAIDILKNLQQGKKFIIIGGEMIASGSIAGIESGGARPVDSFKLLEAMSVPDNRPASPEDIAFADKRRARGLLSGLKKFCDENPDAEKAKDLYREKLNKFKIMFGDKVSTAKA